MKLRPDGGFKFTSAQPIIITAIQRGIDIILRTHMDNHSNELLEIYKT